MAPHALTRLQKSYARLLGRYELVDREIEYVEGTEQILNEIDRIDRLKREMHGQLDVIARKISGLDPSWVREAVRPVYAKSRKNGTVSRLAYQALREHKAPMKTREIARVVAKHLGIEPIQRELVRLENAIGSVLKGRLGKTIIKTSEKPIMWAVMPRDRLRSKQ